MISATNLSKNYGDFLAVDDLTFTVGKGEIVGLLGPNGAGKTTTLRMLAGIHPPTKGTVEIAGISMLNEPVAAKQQLAFMPDEPRLFDYLTVDEHLQFTARLYNVTDWRSAAGTLLSELELGDKRNALPFELSRGMKQKLMIACGLLHAPRVMIFDEPLTGLDPLGIRKMKSTIRQRAEGGASVVLSSHLLPLVEELCDSILVIHRGRRLAFGTIAHIKAMSRSGSDASLEDLFLEITAPEQ